jgi:hypothetical protein
MKKGRDSINGEDAVFFFINPQGKLTVSFGHVGEKHILGVASQVFTCEFFGSTMDGACGGVYYAIKDGAFLGWHGIGNTKPSSANEFYPWNPAWDEEVSKYLSESPKLPMVADLSSYKYETDLTYESSLKRDLNVKPKNL